MNKPKSPEMVAIDNTLKLLRRGKWEMEGEEMLAFYYVFEFWAKKLIELNAPIVPTIVEEPIKPVDPTIPSVSELVKKPRKSKKG